MSKISSLLFLVLLLMASDLFGQGFIITVKTNNPGTSAANQFTIPTNPELFYDYNVDWGDLSPDENVTGDITHTFPTAGEWQIEITGDFPAIYFNNGGDKDKMLSIDQWGTNKWENMQGAFYGATNMVYNATDVPDLSHVANMSEAFKLCYVFDGDLNSWDVSNVTDMSYTFEKAWDFSSDLSSWDVSNVASMMGFHQGDMQIEHYNSLLANWSQLQLQQGVTLDVSAWYTYQAQDARNKLTDPVESGGFGWTINDSGLATYDPEFQSYSGDEINAPENQTMVFDFDAVDGYGGNTDENVTYSLGETSDGPKFSIDANSGILIFKEAPDFEIPGDFNNQNAYSISIYATNQTDNFEHSIVIVNVTDVDEAPILAYALEDQLVPSHLASRSVLVNNFYDPEGSDLVYSASSNDEEIVQVEIQVIDGAEQAKLTPIGVGTATVTITATDESELSTSTTFFVTVEEQEIPKTSNVKINGFAKVGETLVGTYDYEDFDGSTNNESGTLYSWSAVDNLEGGAITPVDATSASITITSELEGKFLFFAVTPSNGEVFGATAGSSPLGPVVAVDGNATPHVENVTLSGIPKVDQTLTLNYDFLDAESDQDASLYVWYRADDSEGSNATVIVDKVLQTYSLSTADLGKYILGVVIASDGETNASPVSSQNLIGPVLEANANAAPSVTDLSIDGILKEGQVVSVSYSYEDIEEDVESGTTFQWYSADNANGTNAGGIPDAVSQSFEITSAEVDMYLAVKVTPSDGNSFGEAKFSIYSGPVLAANVNTAPSASNVSISGELEVESQLTGSYTYFDAEGSDTESGSSFQWFRSTDDQGADKVAIGGATSKTYTQTTSDLTKYISFSVAPSDGELNGTSVESSFLGPVMEKPLGFEDEASMLVVYPNPSTDRVNIEFSNDYKGMLILSIHSLTGKKIYEVRVMKPSVLFQTEIDISDLRSGTYILNIKQEDGLTKYLQLVKE